jgi:hypothetical protein
MQQEERPTAIFRVLRRPRDEAQLTQLLAAVAGADDDVGGALARAFVSATSEAHASEREALGNIPERLRCRPEAALRSPSGDHHGRVDLRFDDEAREFTLLAELKLHSGYGDRQVERYQDALADLPTGRRAALIAVTRNVPGAGEPPPGTPQWLGSVRWTDVFDALWALPIKDDELRAQWRSLLSVIDEQGDFGVKSLSREEVEGWAAYVKTREKLERLIDDVAPPALEHLRGLLAAREAWSDTAPEATAELYRRGKEQKVPYPTQKTVQARFIIPPTDRHERLRIQFLGGLDEPYFTVEARRYGAPSLLAGKADGSEKFVDAVRSLTRAEPGFDTDERTYVAKVRPAHEWLTGAEGMSIGDALLDHIKTDLETLVESGILDPDSGFDADVGRTAEDDEKPTDEE